MKTGIPTGLASLLGKLGINVGQAGASGKDVKVAKEALQGGAPKDAKGLGGLIKGAAMADGALLAGLGHAPGDKKTEQRNNAEQSNIDRFLQDPASATAGKELPRDLKPSDAERMRDVREQKETREDARREERMDDAKSQAFVEGKIKEDRKTKEEQETRDREKQKDRDQQQQEQDEDHPGGAWVLEEQREEEEKRNRAGVREEDTLGAVSRCRGHLEDGSPCLRKPMQGTPYCREHVLPH